MRPTTGLAFAAAVLLAGTAPSVMLPGRALFLVSAPAGMVTGPVRVRATTVDENVHAVRWTVDDWSRVTPAPFELTFDAGPVPYERRILAVALDKDRRALYRGEATLNPGGRRLELEFRSPVAGQQASGPVAIELRARTPSDDEPVSLDLEANGSAVPLSAGGPGTFLAETALPASESVLVARLTTRLGRTAERTLVLNTIGMTAEAEAHVLEQLVSVTRHGRPVEGLGAGDFTVTDDRGRCDVRDVRLLRDVPLAVGLAIDTSLSLRHTAALRTAAAGVFLERCFTGRDAGFLVSIGPVVRKKVDWTRAKAVLQAGVLALGDFDVAGTDLYQGIQQALYQFQGSQGARALILVSDGYDCDGTATEEAALAYARQSGVKIYAIGLTASAVVAPAAGDPGSPSRQPLKTVVQPANREVLDRFTGATGGKTFLVSKEEDLPEIFRAIEQDIRTQYLVSFVSAARRSGTFHPVEVRATHGLVRTAAGFFY